MKKNKGQVSFDKVFEGLEKDRQKGTLHKKVVKGKEYYEESKDHPKLVVRVHNGKKEKGEIKNGKFKVKK